MCHAVLMQKHNLGSIACRRWSFSFILQCTWSQCYFRVNMNSFYSWFRQTGLDATLFPKPFLRTPQWLTLCVERLAGSCKWAETWTVWRPRKTGLRNRQALLFLLLTSASWAQWPSTGLWVRFPPLVVCVDFAFNPYVAWVCPEFSGFPPQSRERLDWHPVEHVSCPIPSSRYSTGLQKAVLMNDTARQCAIYALHAEHGNGI